VLNKVSDANSDEALLKRMALGDSLACQVFYGRYHVRVFRYVFRMVRNEATAWMSGVKRLNLRDAQASQLGCLA
jgi:hypothetical protein